MKPLGHIIWGLILSATYYFVFQANLIDISIIFFSSVLIDFDHYIFYVQRSQNLSLIKAYKYFDGFKQGKKFMMLFHTLEIHLLVLILSFLWLPFFWVFIGMLFHTVVDLASINIYEREFSFINYASSRNSQNEYY